MSGLISHLIDIIKEKNHHFLFVDLETWKKYKYLIKLSVWINKEYKACEIYRKEYKGMKNIVVIGLKWNGKNVKRRVSGWAKEYVDSKTSTKKRPYCIFCDTTLTYENSTTDHILPIAKGGNNSQVNLIVVCNTCNGDRGDINFYKYLRLKNNRFKNIKYPFV